MKHPVTIDATDILDLVICAEDYGFEDDVLFDAFAGWLKSYDLDQVFAQFCVNADDQYGPDDFTAWRERVDRFRWRQRKQNAKT